MNLSVLVRRNILDPVRTRSLWVLLALFVLVFGLVGYLLGPNQFTSMPNLTATIMGVLAPLAALVYSYESIAGPRQSGSLRVLLTYPYSRRQVVLGTLIGRVTIVLLAIVTGIVAAVLATALAGGSIDIVSFALVLAASLLFTAVIVAVADTHGTAAPRLAGRAADALAEAALTLHAGDFTTPAVYDAFDRRTREFVAVYGNSDEPTLRERLRAVETITWAGWTLLVVHGHEHTATSLPLLARERDADLVVTGHTHRPAIERLGGLPVVNPGSHADPRAGPPTHAELRTDNGALLVEIRDRTGDVIERERVSGA